MTYREYTPPSGVSPGIECVWTGTGAPGSVPHDVLPDGAMDIIAAINPDGDVERAWVVGAMTRPLRTTSSPFDLVAIRFLPGAGGLAMGVHAAELCDASVDLRDILHGAEAVRDALRVLARAPASAHSLTQLASALGGQAPTTTPAALREATYRLAREPQRTSVESMARQVGVSRQQLARLFARHVGLTPKQFSRICRVRSMLASTRERFAGWSRTAAEWGYTDQSHLIADVRAVTGQTPAQWRLAARTTPAIEPVPAKRQ